MSAKRIGILVVFAAAAAAFLFLDLGRYLTLESLKANRASLEALRGRHDVLFPAAFASIYIVQTAFSLPGAAILSLAAGAIFGILQGTVLVVSGATAGAVLAFLVSRTLLRDRVVRKFGARLEGIDRGLRENGLSYLLFLRLVPAFPFFLVNLACGVTGLRLRTYALGTLFGIVPGSFVFVNAGASLSAVESVSQVAGPRVLGSFALLGLFALLPAIARAVGRRREGKGCKDIRRGATDGQVKSDAADGVEPEPRRPCDRQNIRREAGCVMEAMMAARMGRAEFLRAALVLAGGALLDLAIPRGAARAAERPAADTGGRAMEKKPVRIYSTAQEGYVMTEKIIKTEKEWQAQLTPEQFRITRKKGTERAFTGKYADHHEKGVYRCVCCGTDLFRSETKFESGTGWPSFYAPVAGENIRTESDTGWFATRTEVLCARCDAHLGHVFDDGPKPTGLRYCINSAALAFVKVETRTK